MMRSILSAGLALCLLGGTAWLSAPPAAAQRGPDATASAKGNGGQAQTRKGKRRAKRLAKLRAMRLQVLQREVGLSDAKTRRVGVVMEGFDIARREFRQKLRRARRDLQALLTADSNDMGAYKAAMKRMRTAHQQVQDLRRQQFKAVSKLLTPKEAARLMLAMERINKSVRERLRNQRRGGGGGAAPPPHLPRAHRDLW